MKKQAEAFPARSLPHSVMLYLYVFFFPSSSSHCLRSEDTIGRHRNVEKLSRDTQDRERKESNTFPRLVLFFVPPCFPCLPSSKLEPGMSNPLLSRLDQGGEAAELTTGWPFFYWDEQNRQWRTEPVNILLMIAVLTVPCHQKKKKKTTQDWDQT